MKILVLYCLILIALLPVSQAQETPKSQSVQLVDRNSSAALGQYYGEDDPGSVIFKRDLATTDGERVCAYMRTYRVRRKDRGSDVVRPAGYTTCVPAARFTMKSAVQIESAPRE